MDKAELKPWPIGETFNCQECGRELFIKAEKGNFIFDTMNVFYQSAMDIGKSHVIILCPVCDEESKFVIDNKELAGRKVYGFE